MQSQIYNELRYRKVMPVIRTALITLVLGFFGSVLYYNAHYPIQEQQRKYINAQEQLKQITQQIAEFNHNHNL